MNLLFKELFKFKLKLKLKLKFSLGLVSFFCSLTINYLILVNIHVVSSSRGFPFGLFGFCETKRFNELSTNIIQFLVKLL
jgi:hypothetical protein